MPLPEPKASQDQNNYISEFMSNEQAKEDFPDEKQRLAVAYSKWREERGGKKPTKKKAEQLYKAVVNEINERFKIIKTGDKKKVLKQIIKVQSLIDDAKKGNLHKRYGNKN